MQRQIHSVTITLKQGDITREEVDAIVNAANSSLLGGGGVDGAIHRAGGPQILEECKQIRAMQGGCPAGEAVITGGGKLKALHVIHTVGPIWRGGKNEEARVLANAYTNSLQLAKDYDLSTVSFPSISTGAYGYPLGPAAATALQAVREFVREPGSLREVRFVLFDALTKSHYEEALKNLV